jgi:hypothetical protein
MKSSATQKHEIVSYIQAYRTIQETSDDKEAANEALFQVLGPYLKNFK